MPQQDNNLVEGIFQLGIQAAFLKSKPRYSRDLTLRLWHIQNARRVVVEEYQYGFWKLYHQHVAAILQETLLSQVPPDFVIENPGQVFDLLSMAQVKHRQWSIDPITEGLRRTAYKAIPIKVNEIVALVDAIRHFWDSRKSTEPNSPPDALDAALLTQEVWASMEENYFLNHGLALANLEADAVSERLKVIITRAVVNGATARDLAADIATGIGGPNYSGWRAMAIARTEVNSMMNRVNLEAMGRSGVVAGKIWLSMADDAVRDTHREADGQEVPLNQPFIVGGMYMMCPGDPAGGPAEIINCRCDLIPSINPEYIPSDLDYESLLLDIVPRMEG